MNNEELGERMKAIILSIRPEWVEKILNKKKTIEIRNSIPKCNLPIDVYLYCTKAKPTIHQSKTFGDVLDDIHFGINPTPPILNGKVVAKFTLNKWEEINNEPSYYDNWSKYKEKSCVSFTEWYEYFTWSKNGKGYAWHIDNLVIFNTPKELNEFERRYAPQSWCYVEIKGVIEK